MLRRFIARSLKLDPVNREGLTNLTSLTTEKRAGRSDLRACWKLEHDYPGFSPIKAQIGLTYAKVGNMEQALDYLRPRGGFDTGNPRSMATIWHLCSIIWACANRPLRPMSKF